MKKYILVFLLAACAAFSACGADEVHSTPESATISDSESVVLTEQQHLVTDVLETKTVADFFGNSVYGELSRAGYTVEVKNKRLGDDDYTVLYDVEFTNKKSGEIFLFEKLSASLDYTIDGLSLTPYNLHIEGAAVGVCDEEIYIADLDRIRFFDADTFERTSTSVYFENDGSHNVMFYNVMKNDGTYIIACQSGGEYVILMTSGQGGVYKFSMNLEDDSYIPLRHSMSIRENYPSHILFGDSYCYDSDQQALYMISESITGENGGEAFYFERWESLSTTGGDFYQLTGYKDGVATVNVFEDLDLNEVFGTNQQTGEFGTNVTMEFANENRDVVIHCPDSQTTVTLDRETGSSSVVYTPDARQISTTSPNPIRSADSRYTIYRGASAGGGDYSVSQMLLHDSDVSNKDNMYRYIGTVSTGQDIGFFTNNDIYIFSNTEFTVYKAGMPTNEPEFVMSRNFHLGVIKQDETYARYLFAARRDPVTDEYIVIYANFPEYNSIEDLAIDENGTVLQPTYKVGLLNSDGVIQRSIDTGVNVFYNAFGFTGVNMVKPSEDTIRFTVKHKNSVLAETIVNLDTEAVEKLGEAEWTDVTDPQQTEQPVQSESTQGESSSSDNSVSSSSSAENITTEQAENSIADSKTANSSSDSQTEN